MYERKNWLGILMFFVLAFCYLQIMLTPAFAETEVSGTISTNTTWTKAGSPYIVTGNITVKGTLAILNIEPGVEVRFERGTGMTVESPGGSVIAKGTQTSPIRFTSNLASPAPGDWTGIYFGNDTREATLEYCVVEYGGLERDCNIYGYGNNITMKNCTVQKSSKSGIRLYSSSSTIGGEGSGNVISDNGTYGIYSGISCSPVISHNTFSGNGSYPIRTGPNAQISGNVYSDNGKQVIEVVGGNVTDYVTWKNEGGISEYEILGNITVKSTVAILNIEPGVEVRFERGTGMTVESPGGSVIAKGTQTSPIRFTSNLASPAPGDWAGIYFGADTKEATLEYCVVEYGGFDDMPNIYISGTSPTVHYSTIRYSSLAGIYIRSGKPVIECNTIEENVYGIYVKDVSTGLPPLVNNDFLKNEKHGLYNEDTQDTVDAENNWWNDTGGPDRNGDKIFGNVTTVPYLTAKSEYTPLPEKTAYQQGYEAGLSSCGIWDVDGDGKIGLAEAVDALQIVTGLRKID